MYDLPMVEAEEKKEYSLFRKNLIKLGYMYLQSSIYVKIINTSSKFNLEIKKLENILPSNGNIRVLKVTDSQYLNMQLLRGRKRLHELTNNGERYIKIKDD